MLNELLGKYWNIVKKADDKRIAALSWPEGLMESLDIPYTDSNHPLNRLDVIYPANAKDKLPVIVDIHGGGWMYGDKELNKNYVSHLASRGAVVFSVSYRLYPEVCVDGELRDVMESLKWIKEHLDDYPCDKDNIYFTGDSAGGMLCCFATALCSSEALRKAYGAANPEIEPNAICLTSPMLYMDPKNFKGIYTKIFLGKNYKAQKWGSYINLSDLLAVTTLPPTLLTTSSGDFPARDQTLRGYEELLKNNITAKLIDVPTLPDGKKLGHVFPVLDATEDNARKTIDEMFSFFSLYEKAKV